MAESKPTVAARANCAPYFKKCGSTPKSVASRSCWATQASVEWRLTPTWTTRCEACAAMTKAKSDRTWTLQYPTVHGDGTNSRPFAADPPQRPEQVWQSISYMIARYFHQPTYWRIGGAPVLVIYEAGRLRDTFGVAGTRQLLAELRTFARKLGHAGLHVHASHGSLPVFGELEAMGFDSYGLYSPILLAAERRPPEEELPEYGVVAADVAHDLWPRVDALSPLPCFPAASPGWDTTPRRVAPRARATPPNRTTWPVTSIVVDETPAAFEALLNSLSGK